ncbi:MAG: class I SAM-dependent methyltransferase [Flavobacteriales bacterium]|nr:class I SAM-dependent methyltransferase [Flavobacteriales bacterium]
MNHELEVVNGVRLLSKRLPFEEVYLKVRERESRLYTDKEVCGLPDLPKRHVHAEEWQLRKKSMMRFLNYLGTCSPGRVLDLGCGNGWFSFAMRRKINTEVVGLDMNTVELEQAARVFKGAGIHFCYGDVFQDIFPPAYFDVIILNSSIQYFPDVPALLNRLKYFATPGGELHVLDSPMYKQTEVDAARERSRKYYENLGVEAMCERYFYHGLFSFEPYPVEVMYWYGGWRKALRWKDIPFPWLKIRLGG